MHRELSKRLSALLDLPALEALTQPVPPMGSARRIAFSGPPGSGKSSLIGAWARLVLSKGRSIGVLAIDPSSPVSQGSLLGDRIRMDDVTEHPNFFLRSIPSRRAHDGLCPNALSMLDAIESSGFDEVVLETVGVGQSEHGARALVDTFVLVMNPETGDAVQAMKAGILEVADIIVVNKTELPAAQRLLREMESVVEARHPAEWRVPVIPVSAVKGTGIDSLSEAIRAHKEMVERTDASTRARDRQRHRVRCALIAHWDQVITAADDADWDLPVEELLRRIAPPFSA